MIRDENSRALLQTDELALNNYRIEKRKMNEFSQMKNDLQDLKQAVKGICEKLEKLLEEK